MREGVPLPLAMNFRQGWAGGESLAASGVEFSEAAGVKFRRLRVWWVFGRVGQVGKWAESSDSSKYLFSK
jgi:hypothetical protein